MNEDYTKMLEKVASATDYNNHNWALVYIADFYKETRIKNRLDILIELHTATGHMTQGMIKVRNEISAELFGKIEKEHGIETVGEINSNL